MKDKNGKVKPMNLLIGSLVVVALVIGIGYALNMFGVVKIGPQSVAPTGNPAIDHGGSTPAQCALAPSLVNVVTDALTPGTAISATPSFRDASGYLGTTAPTYADNVDILYNATGYLSVVDKGNVLTCGANKNVATMYALTNATLTYYSDTGLVALVQSTANETTKGAGAAYNWRLHFQGVDKKSTGKQLLIVEVSVPANVSNVVLTPQGLAAPVQVVAVPNGYARQGTNSYAAAFLIGPLTGANAVDYTLTAQSASAKVITGQVYTTLYSVQPFVDIDGTFSDSGLAFDGLNAAKWATSQTKNFIIN